jgi:hypothetical protein
LTPRKYAVLRFVAEQARTHDKLPPWRTLLEQWNEQCPEGHDWHYKETKNPSHRVYSFKRDFEEARKSALRPQHDLPKHKAITSLEAWQEEDLKRRRDAARSDLDMIRQYLEGYDPSG